MFKIHQGVSMGSTVARNVAGAITLVVAVLVLMAPTASAKSCRGAAAGATRLSTQQAERTALCLMNQRRAKRGLRKLRYNPDLAAAAQNHSAEMDALNYFDHNSPSGSSPVSRVRAAGYLAGAGSWGIGENIASGSGDASTPKGIITMWMNSPGHRQIMLSRDFRHVGIGVVSGSPDGDSADGAIYTADFGYRR
jgi:uncharacterized protein YkwD